MEEIEGEEVVPVSGTAVGTEGVITGKEDVSAEGKKRKESFLK